MFSLVVVEVFLSKILSIPTHVAEEQVHNIEEATGSDLRTGR
jgi:hypothetical protein